jgi:UDP-N-acetylmuramoyl-tripeptide--D-alanyl-D-alanine ligase
MKNYNIDPSRYIKFQTLLLQLEEYDVRRYLGTVMKTWGQIPGVFRKPIVWTTKLRVLTGMATAMLLASAYLSSRLVSFAPLFLLATIIFCYGYFVFLAIASLLFSPFDFISKMVIISRAKRKVQQMPDLKIIGIAGSYGKTLMKEMVAAVLGQKYRILSTPENINTPMGISRLILTKLSPNTDFLIVEMGEYTQGDILAICDITPPHIGVITGINEAHLERMGTMENTTRTVFELADEIKPDGLLLLNAQDERVRSHGEIYGEKLSVIWYGRAAGTGNALSAKNFRINAEGTGSEFDVLEGTSPVMQVRLPLLAEYAAGHAIAAAAIGRRMGMSWEQISAGLSGVTPPTHRLQPIVNRAAGILVIDDSYNGNPDGVDAAIAVLKQFPKRRKVYITPGLVEMGNRSKLVHIQIGKKLADVADLVILVDNSVTPFIAQGLIATGFPDAGIIRYPDALSMHAGFGKHIKPGDVVLFQNDWTDNYV